MRQAGCGRIAMRQDERKLEVRMKIGIISDTRARSGEEIPQEVARAFEGVDRIFHAGGIHSKEVLDWLERIAPVTAAARLEGGQAEQPQPFMLEVPGDPRVAQQQVIELEGQTIGMVNEIWLPRLSDEIMPGSIGRQRLPDQLLTQMVTDFFETPIDVVVESGLRAHPLRRGGRARGDSLYQPRQPVAAQERAKAGPGCNSGAWRRKARGESGGAVGTELGETSCPIQLFPASEGR